MKAKILFAGALALTLAAAAPQALAQNRNDAYRLALTLYDNGMYERARALFESVPEQPESRAYTVLCAIKTNSSDAERLFSEYLDSSPDNWFVANMRYLRALNYFDDSRYNDAAYEFSRVDPLCVSSFSSAESVFKQGYCEYELGNPARAASYFHQVDLMPVSEYSSTARYLLGYMAYTDGKFSEAENWFAEAGKDEQYASLSKFYIIDCEFNMKNYDFVLTNGLPLYEEVPAERRPRLARMLSESYLIKGDTENAYKFYDKSSHSNMTRADYFYAGSVLYAVQDYQGAIRNFNSMGNLDDDLGQIAQYHLANCYLQTHNNVAAMEAFKAASELRFDQRITEDAMFNYAKLAFDLNKDPEGFNRYIRTYSTTTKGDQIYGYIALASLYNRDYAAAVEAYNHIDYLEPEMRSNYIKANFLRASQLIASGSWKDAIPCLKATAYYLDNTDRLNQYARYWLAETYFRADQPEAAREIYTSLYNAAALMDSSEGSLLPYNVAYCYLAEEDWKNAARWFDIYADAGALLFREDALTRRADCDFARKDYKSAISSYQRVLSEFFTPGNIYPYYRQALCYGLTGSLKKKVQVLSNVEKAAASAPLFSEAMYELGSTHLELKNYTDAGRVFSRLRASATDSTYVAKSLIGLGMVARNSGDYDKALEYYKSVVALLPGSEFSEDALLAIESIYQSLKQPEKYLAYVEENALKKDISAAEREQMYFNTAEQVYLGGDAQQSVSALLSYIEKYPDGARLGQAYFYLADSYKTLGNKEKAVEAYSKAIERGSDDSFTESSRLGYASLSYSLERYQDAYKGYSDLLKSARMEANRNVAKLGMMRSAYRAKLYEDAISAASSVLLLPDNSSEIRREAEYVQAKSYLSTSRRNEALAMFGKLSAESSTPEGAEASYILIQDIYDNGKLAEVEPAVYEFSQKCGEQSYWLAKAYVVLGDSFLGRGMNEQAKATFESIRDGYEPSSDKDEVLDLVKIRLERINRQ